VSRPSWRVGRALGASLAAAAVAGIVLPAAGAVPLAPFELWVVFHENHTITVTFDDGTPVGSLGGAAAAIAPGSYTLHFEDSVGVEGPDFDLRGPGVQLREDLFFGEAPSATHRVTFLPSSTYTWRNAEQPNVVFTFSTHSGAAGSSSGVASGGSSSAGSTGKTSTSKDVVGEDIVPFRGTLTGNVSTTGRLTLKYLGKAISSLKPGRYRVTVLDETSKSAFFVQRKGRAAIKVSSADFIGRESALIQFTVGEWFFYAKAASKSSFTVTR
jgi:hypothetical protein